MYTQNMIKPCYENHAIEEAVFVIRLTSPLSQKHFDNILSLKETHEIKATFPRIRQTVGRVMGVKFEKDQQPVIEPETKSNLTGIFFERFKPSGLAEKVLAAEGDRIVFHCFEYTRWNEIWQEARNFLKAISFFLSDLRVAIVALNVRDKFIFKGSPKSFDPAILFKKGSPYLTPNIFKIRELWHCHHGYFEKVTNQKVDKELLVTNTSTEMSGSNELNAKINCFFEARLNPPGIDVQELFDETDLIDELMTDLHYKNKKVLNDIIVKDMAKRIDLEL